jgi:hypothetical protein
MLSPCYVQEQQIHYKTMFLKCYNICFKTYAKII